MKEKKIYKSKWFTFWWDFCFDVSYETCGYFDARPRINLCLFFFHLELILPFPDKKWANECDSPKWGFAYHNQTFWIYRGGEGNRNGGNKWWTMYVPWYLSWVRTSALRIDGTWEHEVPGATKDLWADKWKGVIHYESHPYTYVLKNGEVQNRIATLRVEEREWRWHWFKWLPLTKHVNKTISVDFDGEVGERSGSWKGGTVGCSYTLKKGETPLQCLRRMEKERKF